MSKKKIIILGTLMALLFATVGFSWANSALNPSDITAMDHKMGISYSEAMRSDKPSILLFYTDWCGYCKKFMPKFRALTKIYKDDFNFVMINGDAAENQALMNDVAITGLPTVYIFDAKYNNRILINNGYYFNLKKMRGEFDRFLSIRKKLDASESCTTPQIQ